MEKKTGLHRVCRQSVVIWSKCIFASLDDHIRFLLLRSWMFLLDKTAKSKHTNTHKKRLACLCYWLTDFRSCYECLPGQSRQSANSNPLHYHLAFHQWKVQTEAEPPSIMYRPTPPILLPHIIMTLMKQCKSIKWNLVKTS